MIGRTNTGIGGSIKGTDAILRVIAPAGSTVTISKGGASKSDLGHESASDPTLYDYYFVIHQSQFDSINAWTVTATLGTQTSSYSVIIDSSDEYDITLIYGIYLVKDGLLTDVAITKFKTTNTIVQNTGYVRFSDTSNNTIGIFSSTDAVDLTPFNTLKITLTGSSSKSYKGNTKVPTICIGSSRPTTSGGSGDITNIIASTKLSETDAIPAGDYTLDISSYSGLYYIALCMAGTGTWKFLADVVTFGVEV